LPDSNFKNIEQFSPGDLESALQSRRAYEQWQADHPGLEPTMMDLFLKTSNAAISLHYTPVTLDPVSGLTGGSPLSEGKWTLPHDIEESLTQKFMDIAIDLGWDKLQEEVAKKLDVEKEFGHFQSVLGAISVMHKLYQDSKAMQLDSDNSDHRYQIIETLVSIYKQSEINDKVAINSLLKSELIKPLHGRYVISSDLVKMFNFIDDSVSGDTDSIRYYLLQRRI
jgi:hypothetical protein